MPSIEVAAGLIFRRGRLLIARRRPGDHLGGLWEFPGGKREPGESLPEALRRELREELGVEVDVGELIASVRHDYAEWSVDLRFYRCEIRVGEPRPIGCAELAWIGSEQLQSYEFPPADQQILDLLRRSPELWSTQAKPGDASAGDAK